MYSIMEKKVCSVQYVVSWSTKTKRGDVNRYSRWFFDINEAFVKYGKVCNRLYARVSKRVAYSDCSVVYTNICNNLGIYE